jgi:ATP-dependent DNA helicase RecQ
MMRGYAEEYHCRREYLLNYFGEVFEPPCNGCDNCDAGHGVPAAQGDVPFPMNSRVVHRTLGPGLLERYEGDTLVVLFDDGGYKQLATELVVDTGVLVPEATSP